MFKTAVTVAALAMASDYGMAVDVPSEFLKHNNVFSCMACSSAMDAVDWLFDNKFFEKVILEISTFVCIALGLARTPLSYCPGIVPQMGEWAFPVFTSYFATRDRFCDEYLGVCSQPVYEYIDLTKVVGEILATKPLNIRNDDFVNQMYAQIAADPNFRETYLAVHISDAHLDNLYTEGTVMNCPGYLCCHESDG